MAIIHHISVDEHRPNYHVPNQELIEHILSYGELAILGIQLDECAAQIAVGIQQPFPAYFSMYFDACHYIASAAASSQDAAECDSVRRNPCRFHALEATESIDEAVVMDIARKERIPSGDILHRKRSDKMACIIKRTTFRIHVNQSCAEEGIGAHEAQRRELAMDLGALLQVLQLSTSAQ
jgi:hypothetical protein